MSDLLSLAEIRSRVDDLARKIEAPSRSLPRYDSHRDGLFVGSDRAYHLVYVEPGRGDTWRKTTLDIDELLYWIFQSVTFEMASKFELQHRNQREDSRRQLFEHQEDLMNRLNSRWKERLHAYHSEVLRDHPFNDWYR